MRASIADRRPRSANLCVEASQKKLVQHRSYIYVTFTLRLGLFESVTLSALYKYCEF